MLRVDRGLARLLTPCPIELEKQIARSVLEEVLVNEDPQGKLREGQGEASPACTSKENVARSERVQWKQA